MKSEGLFQRFDHRSLIHFSIFLVVALSMSYYYVYLVSFYEEYHQKANFELMLTGTADTPFQYRVFVVWLLKATMFVISSLTGWGTSQTATAMKDLMIFVEVAFVFGIVVLFRMYLAQYFRSGAVSSILAFMVFLVLPYNYLLAPMYTQPFNNPPAIYHPVFYMYDLPSLFFFTLGVLLLSRRKMFLFYILFAVATLNRETTCFLTMIYAFDALGRERPKTIAAHVLGQAAIWGGIKYGLFLMYGSNPGAGLFELHFFSNVRFITVFKRIPTVISNLGGLWIPVLLLYRYIPDRFVRRASLVVVPFFVGMAIVGNVYELRIYGELIPVVLPAVLIIIKELVLRFERGSGTSPEAQRVEARMEYDI